MKKFFGIIAVAAGADPLVQTTTTPTRFATKDEAIDHAKRKAGSQAKSEAQYDFYIMEALAMTRVPVPNVDVIDLK